MMLPDRQQGNYWGLDVPHGFGFKVTRCQHMNPRIGKTHPAMRKAGSICLGDVITSYPNSQTLKSFKPCSCPQSEHG